jgi:hypothetical protein
MGEDFLLHMQDIGAPGTVKGSPLVMTRLKNNTLRTPLWGALKACLIFDAFQNILHISTYCSLKTLA